MAEDAHAETVAKLGPLNPCRIEITPGAMSGINLGMKKPDPQRWVQFESFA